jgi:hypothetical protein
LHPGQDVGGHLVVLLWLAHMSIVQTPVACQQKESGG